MGEDRPNGSDVIPQSSRGPEQKEYDTLRILEPKPHNTHRM